MNYVRIDNVILTKNWKIIQVEKMYSWDHNNVTTTNLILKGFLFKTVDLFNYPVPSRKIGIFDVSQKQHKSIEISVTDVEAKCILTHVKNKTVALSLLHTWM